MVTTFKLDMGFLDDRLKSLNTESREVEIHGEVVGYFRRRGKENPSYSFYLNMSGKNGHGIPPNLLETYHELSGHHGELIVRLKNANVEFMPIENLQSLLSYSALTSCEAFYVENKFIKGDEETLKKYGVTIVSGN